jgi:hypothetical protein
MGLKTPYCKQTERLQTALAGYNNKWEDGTAVSLSEAAC